MEIILFLLLLNVDRTHFWYNLTTSESKKTVRAYLAKQGIDYRVALNDDKVLSSVFNECKRHANTSPD